jgi:hypothetical protein
MTKNLNVLSLFIGNDYFISLKKLSDTPEIPHYSSLFIAGKLFIEYNLPSLSALIKRKHIEIDELYAKKVLKKQKNKRVRKIEIEFHTDPTTEKNTSTYRKLETACWCRLTELSNSIPS